MASGPGGPWGALTIYDPALAEIIRGHLNLNGIANDRTDAETPHPAGRVGDNTKIILQLDAEAPVGKDFLDPAVEDELVLFGQDLKRPGGW